jgi:hypothetical protein
MQVRQENDAQLDRIERGDAPDRRPRTFARRTTPAPKSTR